MSDKSFRDRIREEIPEFPDIYAEFYEDFKARAAEGKVENVWHHLFAVPFNGLELDEPERDAARQKLKVKHKHQAVLDAICELGLHELQLGALCFINREAYLKVSAVLDTGLLTPDDIVQPSGKGFKQFEGLAQRMKPDPSDPFFWRSLLEILCRALVAKRGRKPWPLHRTIDLAFDLFEIQQALPDKRWSVKAAKQALKKAPYYAKYSEEVGEERIQDIIDLIGPMDEEGIFVRLRNLFPDTFEKVWDTRIQNQVLREYGIETIMEWAEASRKVIVDEPPNDDKCSGNAG